MSKNILVGVLVAFVVIAAGSFFYFTKNSQKLPSAENAVDQPNAPSPYQSSLPKLAPPPEFASDSAWLNTEYPLTREDLQGKVTVVYFWRSFCSYCQDAHPYMSRLQQRFGNDILLIGIYSPQFDDEKKDEVIQADRERFSITYPTLLDFDRTMWTGYQPLGWPHFFVIDSNGIIRTQYSGLGTETELVSAVEELLKEQGKEIPPEVGFIPPTLAPEKVIPGWMSFVHPQLYIGLQAPQEYKVANVTPTSFELQSPTAEGTFGYDSFRIEFETEYKLPNETLADVVEKKRGPMTEILSEENVMIGGYPGVKVTRAYDIQPVVYYTLAQSRIITIKKHPGSSGSPERDEEFEKIIGTVTFEN